MKIKSIEVEKKEDLRVLIDSLHFSFLEPFHQGLTQIGCSIHDIRPHLALLEFVKDEFQEIETLRSKNPDLLKEFNNIVEELLKLKEKFNKNDELYFKTK